MSRAFIKEDDGQINFVDREQARREREERLGLLIRKIDHLSSAEAVSLDPFKKEAMLARICREREELEALLERDK
ncbi:hypothetical protein KAR29_06480 [Aminithiophilus ramosus]|uniref:Uncharacterized protein n=1 Tax=Aminithiophilus ramosus TaxID=3029084 RepID=A0A9Q7AF54_9BACT|nr:hypothetical protein [Aminithiophilus ramosus]QTX33498.1 hypothetical protein KAR29_06480 [Aminithiophilus ramosus]